MITELVVKEHALYGRMPSDIWFGVNAIDGDAVPFSTAPVGQVYVYKDTTNNLAQVYVKRKNVPQDDDWGPLGGVGVISETVTYDDFTDGGSTSATYVMKQTIPVGAIVQYTLYRNVTGFTGNVSCTLIAGDGTDTDRYMTGTPSIFTTDTSVDAGAVSGTAWHDAAKSVTLTATSSSDWGLVAAGQVTVTIFYFL